MARFKEKIPKQKYKRFVEMNEKDKDKMDKFKEDLEQYERETKKYTLSKEEKEILLKQLRTAFKDKNYKYVVFNNGIRVHVKKGNKISNYDIFYNHSNDTYDIYENRFKSNDYLNMSMKKYKDVYVDNLRNVIK